MGTMMRPEWAPREQVVCKAKQVLRQAMNRGGLAALCSVFIIATACEQVLDLDAYSISKDPLTHLANKPVSHMLTVSTAPPTTPALLRTFVSARLAAA